ncbi:MAG: hypothetical protein J0H73_17275, partial [Salana multivorans]|nr:hypothetical protein [Salana multivorans]
MTVLGTDPVPRLPALARRAVEAAGRARLAEALECATLLDGEHWISRVRTHPAFLSARVAVAEMTMRTWLEEEPSVRTKGAPPEARDRVRAVRVATTG